MSSSRSQTFADYNAAIGTILFLLALVQATPAAPFALAPSPAHARLFAPPHASAAYRFEVTTSPIDDVARVFRAEAQKSAPRTQESGLRTRRGNRASRRSEPREPGPPDYGSWTVESEAILDAFDGAAMYDRSRLARLYGGRSVRVARGPIVRDGAVRAAVLLLSPYPEADLSRLNPGTLVMTVELPQIPDR